MFRKSAEHAGCCSPGFGEKESSKYGLGFSHTPPFRATSASPRDVSEISGHSGCCSPGFGEKESSKYGLGFSHAALSSNKCESQRCFGNQRAFRVLQSWLW